MRICIDFDGVICELKEKNQTYFDVLPKKGAIEKLRNLKESGHYLIIQTARHMKTCEGNLGKVNARIAKDTLNWLEKYNIPYDEIYFGKPWAQVYIDDNAYRFTSWELIDNTGENLPVSNEESQNK